jgi:hypothetical protein
MRCLLVCLGASCDGIWNLFHNSRLKSTTSSPHFYSIFILMFYASFCYLAFVFSKETADLLRMSTKVALAITLGFQQCFAIAKCWFLSTVPLAMDYCMRIITRDPDSEPSIPSGSQYEIGYGSVKIITFWKIDNESKDIVQARTCVSSKVRTLSTYKKSIAIPVTGRGGLQVCSLWGANISYV